MTDGLEALATMEYPGRFIIVGRAVTEHNLVVYGITGRSPPSQARKLVQDGARIMVRPTDESVVNQANRDLLIYPALVTFDSGIVVSNGKQTEQLEDYFRRNTLSPLDVIKRAHEWWSYEPDSPNFTPRISGVVARGTAALGIIRKSSLNEDPERIPPYVFDLAKGAGKLIATYIGENVNPLPSFVGEPLDIQLTGRDPKDVAVSVYGALAPIDPTKDYRVAVAAVFYNIETGKSEIAIINRHDLNGGK